MRERLRDDLVDCVNCGEDIDNTLLKDVLETKEYEKFIKVRDEMWMN